MGHIMEDFLLVNVYVNWQYDENDPTSYGEQALTAGKKWETNFREFVDTMIPEEFQHLIVGPVKAVTNGDHNIVIVFPDGSKTGWSTDHTGIEVREKLFNWLNENGGSYANGYLARFGDSEPTITDMRYEVMPDVIEGTIATTKEITQ